MSSDDAGESWPEYLQPVSPEQYKQMHLRGDKEAIRKERLKSDVRMFIRKARYWASELEMERRKP